MANKRKASPAADSATATATETNAEAADESPAPATARALAITEIREKILHELAFHDLVVNAPRVCKDWQDTIVGSITLQQDLFLRPAPAAADGTITANPFLISRGEITRLCDLLPHQLSRKASWRRMLICQPPLPSVKMVLSKISGPIRSGSSSRLGHELFQVSAKDGNGATMGELIALFRKEWLYLDATIPGNREWVREEVNWPRREGGTI